jgi:hypothetical protein
MGVTKADSKRNLTMNTTEIIRRYVAAWNGQDAAALVSNFTNSPHRYPGLSVEAGTSVSF